MSAGEITFDEGEHGVVRVFALNLDDAAAKPWRDGDAAVVADALGLPEAPDMRYVEVFRPRDMQPMSLTDYLVEGIGLPRDAVTADRARLDALSGHVLLLLSGALGGRSGRIVETPELTHIGTYREPPNMPSFEKLPSDGAKGALGQSGGADRAAPRWQGWGAAILIVAALALVAFLALRN